MTNEEAIRRIKEHLQIHQRKEPRAVNITIALAKAITALEEQRVGHWERNSECVVDVPEPFYYKCTNCGCPSRSNNHNFCPNCGAEMEAE